MSVTVQIDYRAAFRALSRVGGAVHRGTMRGLNDVAFQAMRFERGQMPKRLDRPSKFTISATQVIRARESDAIPEATVRIEDKRAKFLRWQAEDGTETLKSAAQSRGNGSEALVNPAADIVRDHPDGAGRNAVKRARKLPSVRSFWVGYKELEVICPKCVAKAEKVVGVNVEPTPLGTTKYPL